LITSNGIRNEGILEEVKVEPVDKKLRRYKSNWLQHVTRMSKDAKGIAES